MEELWWYAWLMTCLRFGEHRHVVDTGFAQNHTVMQWREFGKQNALLVAELLMGTHKIIYVYIYIYIYHHHHYQLALQPGVGLGLRYNMPPGLSVPCSVSPFVYTHISQVHGHVIQPSHSWSSSSSCCIQLSVQHLFWDCCVFHYMDRKYSTQQHTRKVR